MKTLFRTIQLGVLALLVATLVAGPAPLSAVSPVPSASAQDTSGLPTFRPAFDSISAVSTDIGAYVVYIGDSAAAAEVAVDASTGDLTFTLDSAAVTEFECPVSGSLGGIIDVSDAACNTFGEVASIVNASASWRFLPHAVLAADTSVNTLITASAGSAKWPGRALLKDTVVALNITNVLLPRDRSGAALGAKTYLNPDQRRGPRTNPFAGSETRLDYASETVTSSGAVGNFVVYCVTPTFSPTGAYSEVANVLYQEAGAATTATGTITSAEIPNGLTCDGGKMLVRISATTDLTVPTVISAGAHRMVF